MSALVVSKYKEADEFLRNSTLRQGLYDEGAILMQNEDDIDLPRDKLLKETAYFLFVGALSSTHALMHVMHHVFGWRAAHPEDEARLKGDASFLQRCVWEALRLHPPTPELNRKLTCPVHVNSRPEPVEGGDLVVDMHAVNQDPAQPATMDTSTTRKNWLAYPFLLDRP